MSVRLDGDVVRLQGACQAEDAEKVLLLLQTDPRRRIDLSETLVLHTAVLQVLLAFRPAVDEGATDPFIRTWIEPLLIGHSIRYTE